MRTRTKAWRTGQSLVEILVVMVLLPLLMGLAMRIMWSQAAVDRRSESRSDTTELALLFERRLHRDLDGASTQAGRGPVDVTDGGAALRLETASTGGNVQSVEYRVVSALQERILTRQGKPFMGSRVQDVQFRLEGGPEGLLLFIDYTVKGVPGGTVPGCGDARRQAVMRLTTSESFL